MMKSSLEKLKKQHHISNIWQLFKKEEKPICSQCINIGIQAYLRDISLGST
ncbi:unnamed protein product, partial [Nesidiocoris tenuis]